MRSRRIVRRVPQYSNVPDKNVDPYAEDFMYEPSRLYCALRYLGALFILIFMVTSMCFWAVFGVVFR